LPRQTPKRTLATCCTAHAVHDGFSDVTYVLLPLLAQTFGLSLAQVGMIRSAHRVAMASFQLPAGLIAERFGERNLLAIGTLIAGVAFIALGYAPGYWAILVTLFFAVSARRSSTASSTIILARLPRRGGARHPRTHTSRRRRQVRLRRHREPAPAGGVSWQAPVVAFGIAGIVSAALVFLTVTNSRTHAPQPGAEKGREQRLGHTPQAGIRRCARSTRSTA
jgi:MFS family permease